MNKPPLLSICIPTYNRAPYLKELLDSIVCQFNDPEIYNHVEIIISDNASEDNTAEMVAEYQKKYKNIRYSRNKENIGAIRNILTVSGLSTGEYLWVFSDDDLHTGESLKTVIEFIKKNTADLIFCNLTGFSEKGAARTPNLLKMNEDIVINNRKELFNFLNTKFYTSIDYYTTLCSNWVLKKEIFDKNYFIFEKFNGPLDVFPLPSLVFYSDMEFRSGAIAQQIILNRGDNESWGRKNKIKNFLYRDKIWKDYYKKIARNNKNYLPKYFIFKIHIKNFLRIKDLIKTLIVQVLRRLKVYDKLRRIIKK